MNITGKIKGITYKPFLTKVLAEIKIKAFNINTSPTASLIIDNKHSFAISRWVSPKRTRSYPYERVYNTLNYSKKITVIPVIKDEGAVGDRDYLQWDSISLMSLLDVYVIIAYYETATKKNNKITNQKFNNKYIIDKIKEIEDYHSSALHWNLNELNSNLQNIINKTKSSYKKIEKITGVKLHRIDGIERFQDDIGNDISLFMEFSRAKAKEAQMREVSTVQPKEKLYTTSKDKITIENYLGGLYFFTLDEKKIYKDKITLIESKHSKNSTLPSLGDIKDGLLKMILFSNLLDIKVNGKKFKKEVILNLTSIKLNGNISSKDTSNDLTKFIRKNNLTQAKVKIIELMFKESNHNHFIIKIGGLK